MTIARLVTGDDEAKERICQQFDKEQNMCQIAVG